MKLGFFSSGLVSVLSLATVLTYSAPVSAAGDDLFSTLRGKWGGSGTASYKDGDKDRVVCDANYSGSASQLGLLINCKGSTNNIRMTAQLSANNGKLLGTWKEETYQAIGTISGKATDKNIKLFIGGNMLGSLNVQYNEKKQSITIKTTGISLENVQITLARR